MPAKQTTVFPLRRYTFVGGAATLLLVMVSWVAVRAVEPARSQSRVPLMVQPPMPMIGVDPSLIPLAQATSPTAAIEGTGVSREGVSGVGTPSKTPARRTPSNAAPKPTAKATTKPTPRRTTPPPTPETALSGRYTTGASWDRGFIGNVDVTNKTGPARTWTVKLTFAPSAGVGVGNTWNAQLSRQGNTFVFTGGPLAPGSKISLGFEASKQVRGKIQPATCTVDGAPCQLG
ncbi:cellulose binding domain-containing protein [Actinoplanes sp. ATCC 53533]|uniref:cellulose binding domain-containing protein n=1 Tax=Actinoplanes sp. ATCC 53533 TaxID=1288362 RepID=UPI0013152C52|nr:cellulose binding domain-containing protein [Actinoplanes sp. ATCC 53533]